MTWTIRPARFNLRFVRAVRKALAKGEACCGLVPQTFSLLVRTPEAEQAELYTVCLVCDDEGTCMAVCREVPEVLVFADSEGDVLAAARAAIEKALVARGSVSDVPRPAQPQGPERSFSPPSAVRLTG